MVELSNATTASTTMTRALDDYSHAHRKVSHTMDAKASGDRDRRPWPAIVLDEMHHSPAARAPAPESKNSVDHRQCTAADRA